MARRAAKISKRKEGVVIGVSIDPLGGSSTVLSIDSIPSADCSGLVRWQNDGTNTADPISIAPSVSTPTLVDQTIDYAMSHYENLLRRLAD